jgi:transposase
MKFEDVYGRWQQRRLGQAEAAEILGMSERTFRRWRDRYEDEGAVGLLDRRLGQVSARQAPVDQMYAMLTLYRERYGGFTAKHFHDKLRQHHDFVLGYTWTRLLLQAAGLGAKAPRRGAHRKKRPRRPLTGMLLHQDGSRHRWLPALEQQLDLIVTLDDATSEIYSAFLVEEEGTTSSFRALAEVIAAHGLPCALYTDRASQYFVTPEGQREGRQGSADPGRPGARPARHRAHPGLRPRGPWPIGAGVRHPPGPSAQGARARRHHHGRGRQPLRRETYLREHNGRFAVPPEHPETAFVADLAGVHRDILCVQEERVVGNDNTVRYRGLALQIPPSPLRQHFVKARVRVHDYPDGTLAIFHGPRCLARYRAEGSPLDDHALLAA